MTTLVDAETSFNTKYETQLPGQTFYYINTYLMNIFKAKKKVDENEELEDSVLDGLGKMIENKEVTVEPDVTKEPKDEEKKKVEIETIEDLSLPPDFHKMMKVCTT